MVEHPHVDQRQRLLQALSQLAIRLAWLGHAGRVIVGEDDRRRILRQRTLDHLSRIHAGTVDGAVEQHLKGQHAVFGIEKQTAEQLVRLVTQARLEIVAHRLRRLQRRVSPQPLGQMPARHFQYRLQLGEFRRSQPQVRAELVEIRLQQRPQTTELGEQVASEVHRAFSGDAGAQEYCQQFGVRKRGCALFE
jgi:hypothetical protein